MHSNTSTASILYRYTPSKSSPPSSPSKMKRTKSKPENLNEEGDELNTAFICSSTIHCDCVCCKLRDDEWCHIKEIGEYEDDWGMLFEMDE